MNYENSYRTAVFMCICSRYDMVPILITFLAQSPDNNIHNMPVWLHDNSGVHPSGRVNNRRWSKACDDVWARSRTLAFSVMASCIAILCAANLRTVG